MNVCYVINERDKFKNALCEIFTLAYGCDGRIIEEIYDIAKKALDGDEE